MLSPGEALDIPVGIDATSDEQARIRALGITLGQFVKTLRGRALIVNDERFVLAGKLYQGYNERALECTEDMCSQEEIDSAVDIDGTKQTLLDTRARRIAGAKYGKDNELAGRRKVKIAQERDELELILLKRRIAKEDAEDAAKAPEPEPEIHACSYSGCGKTFGSAVKLNAHKMGAKHHE